ncbi:MAG: DUF1501 domain-containing protein [Planctomycetaceae bacterium]|nr:DUF1501 domain-containing protein [Planctomycetaceae bacterium]
MTIDHHPPHCHATGLRRREVLQVGSSALLGLGLSSVVARANAVAKPKSIIVVFLTGAASHHDTFDLKPDAPAEIRGEFNPIATSVPGVFIGEHLPKLAARAHRYALVRTLSHGDNNHLMSTHHVLTGNLQPGAFFDKVASRDDWPCYSAGLSYLRPRQDGIPSGVNLPTFLMSSPLTWPGQHAGFLGAKYDPWQITGDPNKPDFRVDSLTLAEGLNVNRLGHRRELLDDLNRKQQRIAEVAESRKLSNEQDLAFTMLTSSALADAFQLQRESDAVRDRYGRHTTGQSLLLSRRLIQAGVPIVQCNIGPVQNWDNHSAIFTTLKNRLLPPLDQGMAALLEDLEQTGLLGETLVMMLGEFGRTPKINKDHGRDHWGPCFFGLFAGGGVRGGQVIGKSDAIGAYPLTALYSPEDLGATVYNVLGLNPESEVRDRLNRPVQLNRGKVIEPLFTGAAG